MVTCQALSRDWRSIEYYVMRCLYYMIELYHCNIWCMCGCYADDMIFWSEICVRVAWTALDFCLCDADIDCLYVTDIFVMVLYSIFGMYSPLWYVFGFKFGMSHHFIGKNRVIFGMVHHFWNFRVYSRYGHNRTIFVFGRKTNVCVSKTNISSWTIASVKYFYLTP